MTEQIIRNIIEKRKKNSSQQSLLVGISGIDASGKGFITARLTEELRKKNLNAVNINIDGWLNLPHRRFKEENPVEHFYRFGIRFDEMCEQLIFPLKANRSINLTADFAKKLRVNFANTNTILRTLT